MDKKYKADLFFDGGHLYSLSLTNCDIDFPWEKEDERKTVHDKILTEHGIPENAEYMWGKVISDFDRKSATSQIGFYYAG
jgi:hypothetical protein